MDKLLLTITLKYISKKLDIISCKISNISKKLKAQSLIDYKTKILLNRNKIFKDKHLNKRAFVIVNGPSLKEQDISVLKNDLTFVVSGFYNHKVINEWQPTYYSILDKAFFDGTEKSMNFFKDLNIKIHNSIFFIPLFRGYKQNLKNNLLPKDKVFYIACAGYPEPTYEMTEVVQSFYSVSSFALANAIYMGCSPIYLLGFDHDYLANRGFDKHFYDGPTIPGYNLKNINLSDLYPYDLEMKSNYNLWQNYRSLKIVAEKKGIKIFNATKGGYLDVFERVNYESLF